MAKNQTGVAIVIKAFLPTGTTIDEQFEALSIVRNAHASSDYTELLKAAKVEEVKTEQKTRRVEDEPEEAAEATPTAEEPVDTDAQTDAEPDSEEEIPDFIKAGKKKS